MKVVIAINSNGEEKPFTTVSKAAKWVGLNIQTVRNYFHRNQCHEYERHGKKIRVLRS